MRVPPRGQLLNLSTQVMAPLRNWIEKRLESAQVLPGDPELVRSDGRRDQVVLRERLLADVAKPQAEDAVHVAGLNAALPAGPAQKVDDPHARPGRTSAVDSEHQRHESEAVSFLRQPT